MWKKVNIQKVLNLSSFVATFQFLTVLVCKLYAFMYFTLRNNLRVFVWIAFLLRGQTLVWCFRTFEKTVGAKNFYLQSSHWKLLPVLELSTLLYETQTAETSLSLLQKLQNTSTSFFQALIVHAPAKQVHGVQRKTCPSWCTLWLYSSNCCEVLFLDRTQLQWTMCSCFYL